MKTAEILLIYLKGSFSATAPSTHKYMRHSNHSPLPPFSSPKPPQNNGNDTPVSSPLASFPKHRDVRNKIASSPAPSYFISPTTSIHQGLKFIPEACSKLIYDYELLCSLMNILFSFLFFI